MTTTAPVKEIYVQRGFGLLNEGDLIARVNSVAKGMTGNTRYPTSPVDPVTMQAAADTYSVDRTAALDGSKTAIAAKKKQAKLLIHMLKQVATYVEANTNGDMAAFMTTGFLPKTITRVPAEQLNPPAIKGIKQTASGELTISVTADPGAVSYELQRATLTGGVPGPWTVITFTKVKPAWSVNGLTPGTIYAFQVRAQGKLGYSAWSDSTTRMSI